MKQIVIMPGGFHPFHAGHYALYKSALEAFPQADVYVAATNDQSERPFPFAIKEKLAKLAGVKQGRFVQVKSPFQAKEITQNYDPNSDVLIFVRSEKDKTEQPKPGGTKKDGSPAYFQPWTGKDLQPFSKHAYIAYLPTVTFGPGIQSATEIRNAWPKLDDRRKTAMVMSLYPATQKNPKLAANVVKMLDMGMGGQLNEFAVDGFGDSGDKRSKLLASVGRLLDSGNKVDWQVPGQMGHVTRVQNDGITMKRWKMPRSKMSFFLPMNDDSRDSKYTIKMVAPKHYAVVSAEQGVAEGWKDKVGAAAMAGSMALGGGAAQASNWADAAARGLYYGATSKVAGSAIHKEKNAADMAFADKIPDEADRAYYLRAVKSIIRSRDDSVMRYAGHNGTISRGSITVDERKFNRIKTALSQKYNIPLDPVKEQGVAEGLMNKIANKVMGAAPEQPKYKVGQRVKYETSPHQPDWKDGGSGVGVITAYKNGHYMINGNPVNHFEIKGVVEQGVAEGAPIVVAQAPINVRNPKKALQPYRNQGDIVPDTKPPSTEKRGVKGRPGQRHMPDRSITEATNFADYLDEK